jgi:Recombination endonuclease VII/Domain of unknown function (DUF5664)
MNVISMTEAKAEGRRYYFTGKPCPHGHITKRHVSDRSCMGCKHDQDTRRYHRDRVKEQARSRDYQRKDLPTPTRPCPERCELCGSLPGKRALHLDHDHKTGVFRGWLCHICNLSLGKFGDDIAGLEQAIEYLHRAQEPLFPSGAADRKAIPLVSGVLNYFPSALIEVAKVSLAGNLQHNGPDAPLHWARGKSTDQADTIVRHLMERGEIDGDGMRHSAKLAWRALALLQLELEAAGAPLARGAKLPE